MSSFERPWPVAPFQTLGSAVRLQFGVQAVTEACDLSLWWRQQATSEIPALALRAAAQRERTLKRVQNTGFLETKGSDLRLCLF